MWHGFRQMVGALRFLGAWNTLVEEQTRANARGLRGGGKGRSLAMTQLSADLKPIRRLETGDRELDRVTGGELCRGLPS